MRVHGTLFVILKAMKLLSCRSWIWLASCVYLFFSWQPIWAMNCADVLADTIYPKFFEAKYRGEKAAQFEVVFSEAKSDYNSRLLSTLQSQGADGYHAQVTIKIESKYESYKAAEKDAAEYNANKSSERQFQIESFVDGVATMTMRQNGIVLTELPTHYSAEIKARHKDLMDNGISVVIGQGIDIPIGIGAVAKTSNTFEKGRASGIIFAHPELFGQLVLNHEMQHVFDMILRTDRFFEELPALPPRVADIVDRAIKNEPLTWVEKQRNRSATKLPKVWAEAKASGQSIRNFFRLKGFKEMVLPRGRFREMFMAWTEVINYSFRNLQLFYHQMWIDPLNPRSVVFVFKSGASGYIFVKASSLATQSALYSIVYASSLTGLL